MKRDLLPGTPDMRVFTLSVQSMHGYGIAQHVQRISDNVIRVEEARGTRHSCRCQYGVAE